MNNIIEQHPEIKGWKVDADPQNDPTYPIKKRMGEEHNGNAWNRPALQPVNVEVLTSIERPNMPAVFGNALPPKGLSGAIRRMAFKYGEGRFAHWLPLIIADRVDVVEGIFEDIGHGHFPNILAEKGFKAQWKYDRKAVVTKAVTVGAFVFAGVAAYLIQRNRK